jgi:putative tryptophan/tyrosine transport system substrate-binding protein
MAARIGMLLNLTETDPETQPRLDAFQQGLNMSGVEITKRWPVGDYDDFDTPARDLVALTPAPDVLFATCGPSTFALDRARKAAHLENIPIVFAAIFDPVDTDREVPANATGIISWQFRRCGVFVDLLKAIGQLRGTPVARVAVVRDPGRPAGIEQHGVIERKARPLAVTPIDVGAPKNEPDNVIQSAAIQRFASAPNGGLIVQGAALTAIRRQLIIDLAAAGNLPAVYPNRIYVDTGNPNKAAGLVSYGPKTRDLYRKGGEYVSKVLTHQNGAPVEDYLDILTNRKFELVMSTKTAGDFGIDPVPSTIVLNNINIPVVKVP